MANTKQALSTLVNDLNENEASQVIDFIERLKDRDVSDNLRQLLASHPDLRPPPPEPQPRQRISPLRLAGEAASATLISDRR